MPVNACSEVQGLVECLADLEAAIAASGGLTLQDLTWNNLGGKPSTFTPSAHNHDGSYAVLGHNHDSAYAASNHNHNATYALIAHNHDGTYATAAHNHAGVYQPVGTYLTVFGNVIGSGGTVTQATNKSTAVTLNKATGEITMNAAALAAGAIATFVLNNSTLAAGDMIVTSHHSGGTIGPYLINARVTGNGAASIAVRNTSAASLSEAIVIKFTVIKAVTA